MSSANICMKLIQNEPPAALTSTRMACSEVASVWPATMSSVILQDKLRRELGYQNLIITDAMEMGAITQQYTNGEAAVGCIKAGVDIVLGPQVFTEAFDAVIKAVEAGEITEQRIDESVRRILKLKQSIRK